MSENRSSAVLDGHAAPEPSTAEPTAAVDGRSTHGTRSEATEVTAAAEPKDHEPRRWTDPDEKLALWFVLGFFLLGLYAAAFVTFGIWLTP